MPTLSSSIVKNHVASMREVEEALARQVIYGGDLVTNLLELAAASEAQLTWLLADSLGLEPAPIGELPRAAESLLHLVPAELAKRHAVYPIGESDGALLLAVSDVLPSDVEDDLSFSLNTKVLQRAAPLVRIRQALARDYEIPLDRRMLRLVAKLEGRPDPSPSSMPAPLREAAAGFPKLPRPASIPPFNYDSSGQPALSEERGPSPSPRPPSEPPAPRAIAKTLITPRHPSEKPASPRSVPPPRWLTTGAARERGRRRHRGPYTAAMAERDLLESESRDDVIGAFFDFASQYFEYSALFVLQGDIAEGRDADGPGTDRERIRGIGFPLDLPSALSRAKTVRAFQLVKLGTDGLDANLASDLGRSPGHIVLVLPIVVRGRCVLLLYGDHGNADVSLDEIGDVIAFTPLVSSAIERVILKKKLSARQALAADSSGTPIPMAEIRRRHRHRLPAIQDRVSALAKAFGSTEKPSRPPSVPAPSAPPPATMAASPEALSAPATQSQSPRAKAASDSVRPAPVLSAGPLTRHETPMAKSGPSTADESPQAKVTPGTASDSPAARGAHVVSLQPETPQETPEARRTRQNTPPQGTPRALTPAPIPEPQQDQPFPLTRRAPSSRRPAVTTDAPASSELLAVVDHGWDSSPGPSTRLESGIEPRSDVGHEAPLAPASRQLALGPRPPFRRQDAKDRLLPSVIVDVNADLRMLVDRLVQGDADALDAVVRAGDSTVSLLVAEFPGPLHPDRKKSFAEPGARASDAGLLLRALVRIGGVATPFVVVRTADRDPHIRAWATWLLGELPSAESARAVVRRFSDADPEVRRAALAAGRILQSDVEARTALRDSLAILATEHAQSQEARHDAIQALADLRDGRAVPRLIPLLEDDNAAIQRSATWALETLARQDFGADVGAWRGWWDGAAGHHRIEWLIDALTHERIEVRRAAGEELKTLTKEYFGYYEDLSAKERERTQKAYRDWWATVGRTRFS